MVNTRSGATQVPPRDPIAVMIANLQRRLEAQETEMRQLRAQLAQQNAAPPVAQEPEHVPPPAAQAPPAPVPAPVPVPIPAPVPVLQAGLAAPMARHESLYERFRRMGLPEFDGSTDPLVAEEWLTSIQRLLNFMDITDRDKIRCIPMVLVKDARYWWETVELRRTVAEMSWNDFVQEFNKKYYNSKAMRKQQDEFSNIKQGTLSVIDAVQRFERLARLCPHMVTNEEEKVRRMMEMFRSDIATMVDVGDSAPSTVAECVDRAIRAEYRLAQEKEDKKKFFEERKKEKGQAKQSQDMAQKGQGNRGGPNTPQSNNNKNKRKGNFRGNFQGQRNQQKGKFNNSGTSNAPPCPKCGKSHQGECRMGTNQCFNCGKEGHFSRNCPMARQGQGGQIQQQRQQRPQLHAAQASIEGPRISQGRLEASQLPDAHVHAFSKADVEAGPSTVVTGQISIATLYANALFDSGASHSFISRKFTDGLSYAQIE